VSAQLDGPTGYLLDSAEPAHVYAMAQHVELREAGWWEEAIDRTVQFILYTDRRAVPIPQLVDKASKILDATLDAPLIKSRIERLISTEGLFRLDGGVTLAESVVRELEIAEEDSKNLESACRSRYARCLELPLAANIAVPSWEGFKSELLMPLISELGARTFNLLRGDTTLPKTRVTTAFFDKFLPVERSGVQAAVSEFLDPSDSEVRRFVLSYLTHYMLVASGSLDRETLRNLHRGAEARPEFNVVLDTNVVFSLLNLHYNPSNEAAQAFLELTRAANPFVSIRLYVLRDTVDEAVRALTNARDSTPRFELTRNVAKAAESVGQISGLIGKYFETVSKSRVSSPAEYFDPYITSLDLMLADSGIVVISEGLDQIRQDPNFDQKVRDWYSFEFDKTDGRGRGQITHDMMALEYVAQQREGKPSRIAEAKWWFLTVDFGLQSHEKKGLQGNRGVPRSINPAELVQVLRFWVPRSDKMEAALLGGIRLPFSFFTYDNRAQRTSLKIIERLSRYANIAELSVSSVEKILTDDSVRTAFEDPQRSERDRAGTIDTSFSEAARKTEEESERLRAENRRLRSRLSDAEVAAQKRHAIRDGMDANKRTLIEQRDSLALELEKERRRSKTLEQRHGSDLAGLRAELGQLRNAVQQERDSQLSLRRLIDYSLAGASLAILMAAFFGTIRYLLHRYSFNRWEEAFAWYIAACLLLVSIKLLAHFFLQEQRRVQQVAGRVSSVAWGWLGAGAVAAVLTFSVAPPK